MGTYYAWKKKYAGMMPSEMVANGGNEPLRSPSPTISLGWAWARLELSHRCAGNPNTPLARARVGSAVPSETQVARGRRAWSRRVPFRKRQSGFSDRAARALAARRTARRLTPRRCFPPLRS